MAERKKTFIPSKEVKRRISNWEGKAMVQSTIDPLSRKKVGKNNSFESEAAAFYKQLPAGLREAIVSNQELADNLFSYSYNVGAGNFRERVVPALVNYYNGYGTAQDVADSMWASGDKKLKGLKNRRAYEKNAVINALPKKFVQDYTEIPDALQVITSYPTQVDNTYVAPQMVPNEGSYVEAHPLTQEEIRKEQINTTLDNINRFNNLMRSISIQNNPVPQYRPANALYIVNSNAEGGFLQPKDAWDTLSMAEKAEMIRVGVRNGLTNIQDIRNKYNEFAEGGSKGEKEEVNTIIPFTQRKEVIITPDSEYNRYLNTLPDNQRFTPNDKYDSYFYWKLNGRPRNFEEAYNKGMFHYDHSDNGYHANSIAFDDNTGVGYFMKPKTHDTVGYELDWFNKGLVTEEGGKQRPVTPEEAVELEEFRKNYFLTNDPDRPNYYRYQPIEKAEGGGIHIKPSHRGRLTELKKRTSKTEAELYNDGNPAHKKMVVFARNAKKWKHDDGGEIVYGHPYYSYDENGKRIGDTLNYNAAIPEIVITPDSRKSPGERAVLERQRRANQERATGRGTYDAMRGSEWTGLQQLAAQKTWEESAEKKALDYAQAATAGIGIGADIASGLPIYSSLKGASVLSRAETPLDYAEGAMWVAPALGGSYQITKPVVKQAIQTAIDNSGFAVSSPRIGKIFGKDAGQFTAWVPFDRPWSEGLSWINTGAPTSEGLPVQYITSKHSGEGRKLYDAVINKAREEGHPGIITGRELISAPKTYRTLEHYYPNRVKLDDMGHWSNDSMTGLFEGPRKTVYSLDDFLQSVQETPNERVHFLGAPRYRLEAPSTAADRPETRSIIIESNASANPNLPYDEVYDAASKGRHEMKNLITSDEYANRIGQAYQENGLHSNQAGFEIKQMEQTINDTDLKVVPNLKNGKGEVLNGLYDPNTGTVTVAQDRDNILDVLGTSQHEYAHATEIEKVLDMLKKKWSHIKPRKEAYTKASGETDTEWRDYISSIKEMRSPAMAVWSTMKERGFKNVGDYLNHLKKFGMKDEQWENLVNRFGLTNAKYMVETVFGLSPLLLIKKGNDEEKGVDSM